MTDNTIDYLKRAGGATEKAEQFNDRSEVSRACSKLWLEIAEHWIAIHMARAGF